MDLCLCYDDKMQITKNKKKIWICSPTSPPWVAFFNQRFCENRASHPSVQSLPENFVGQQDPCKVKNFKDPQPKLPICIFTIDHINIEF